MTRKRLFRWVLLVTLAEATGFTVPAAGMALTAASSRPILTLVTMVVAGSVEGAVLGSAQADCLYRWRVLPVRRWWIIATSLGAAFAWSLGMLPSTLGGLSWTARTAVAVGIGGLMLLTSLPLAQYFVLRDHVERASLWIPINVAAWLLGIAWTLLPSPWIDQSTPTGRLVLVYAVAGLCMAATVDVVTGLGMIRLLPPPTAEKGANRQRSSGWLFLRSPSMRSPMIMMMLQSRSWRQREAAGFLPLTSSSLPGRAGWWLPRWLDRLVPDARFGH